MAWTNVGFDGTINEAQWSALAGLLGNGYVAAGNGDCVVTAVPGARSVSVAAGSLYGDGVLSTNSGAETVAMTTPVNGQWYVIALRRTWASNSAALVAIAGATTTTTTPTAPPTSFPTLNTNVGVLTDQPIAWAWCNSANTTVVVYDIRLKAVKSLPPVVANATERDAKFMTPTQGLQVFRNDGGVIETYYELYNVSTNPGGRDVAGWYSTTKTVGLVPIRPSVVSIATGTGSANALGTVTFNGATSLSIDGVFTGTYRNYKMILEINGAGTGANYLYTRFRAGGTTTSTNSFYYGGQRLSSSGTIANWGTATSYDMVLGFLSVSGNQFAGTMEIESPWATERTKFQYSGTSSTNTEYVAIRMDGAWAATNQFDGLNIFPDGGNISGRVTIYGYNN